MGTQSFSSLKEAPQRAAFPDSYPGIFKPDYTGSLRLPAGLKQIGLDPTVMNRFGLWLLKHGIIVSRDPQQSLVHPISTHPRKKVSNKVIALLETIQNKYIKNKCFEVPALDMEIVPEWLRNKEHLGLVLEVVEDDRPAQKVNGKGGNEIILWWCTKANYSPSRWYHAGDAVVTFYKK